MTQIIQTTIMAGNHIKMTQKEVDEKLVEEMLEYIKRNGIPRIMYKSFSKNRTDNTFTEK